MPYIDHVAHREYVPEEYPKMLVENGKPVLYPAGHAKQGLPVIWENADEEKAHFKSGAAPKKATKKDSEYGHPVRD